jgi:hypothetical protein
MNLPDKTIPDYKSDNSKKNNKEDDKGNIREGQKDSSISQKGHIKDHPYPGTSKSDKQYDSQEEFITPPVTHPGEEE